MAELRTREALAARALEFCILTATQTGEVLGPTWGEIDLNAKIWSIPAPRGGTTAFPSPVQRLRSWKALPHSGQRVMAWPSSSFPGQRPGRPRTGIAMAMLLRRQGRDVKVTTHGFHSTLRDWAGDDTLLVPIVSKP